MLKSLLLTWPLVLGTTYNHRITILQMRVFGIRLRSHRSYFHRVVHASVLEFGLWARYSAFHFGKAAYMIGATAGITALGAHVFLTDRDHHWIGCILYNDGGKTHRPYDCFLGLVTPFLKGIILSAV